MAWVFEKSPTWRRIVAKTRESPSFYAGFAAACFAVPYGLGKAVMWATNPEVARKRDMALQAELRGRQTYHHEVSHAEWLHCTAGTRTRRVSRRVSGNSTQMGHSHQCYSSRSLSICVCAHMQRLSVFPQVSFRLLTGLLCGHAEAIGKNGSYISQPLEMCACRVSQRQIDKGLPSCWERFKVVNTVKTGMRRH